MTLAIVQSQSESLSQAVGRNVRGLLGEQRISQTVFARMVDTNIASLSRRLNGLYPINCDELEQYARALGVTVERLMQGSAW
ncbi:helix-turn-helix transcriptional regulator [Gordonia sp. TBRC 11910]|uniref:Helix-turn-helix transcriptional regulator n=1 Tax=Gordonia asplenii TaxID=2725283 RepID=A0A848KP94_9ACTN|nr:helix-turn-helix transcriptional regulator [Gordonia asplenii]NMO00864.1 helix-turn-helix transcriptional regulator [Gordonia asplenii]